MGAKPSFSTKIRKLLLSNTVMSLTQMRHELGNRPRSSLFRDLKKLDLITSYSHAGQYHALESAANAIVITDAKGQISWVNPAF